MKFNEYHDIWSISKRSGMTKANNFTDREQLYSFLSRNMTDQLSRRHLYFDQWWHRLQCPYYDIYPSIIPMLVKINLDISGEHIIDTYIQNREEADSVMSKVNHDLRHLKGLADWLNIDRQINQYFCSSTFLPHLLIRLPECDHQLCFTDPAYGKVHVKTIFMSFQPVNMKCVPNHGDQLIYGVTIGIDIGEKIGMGLSTTGVPTYLMNCIPLRDQSLINAIDLLPEHDSAQEGVHIPKHTITDCVKLCMTVRLIKDDHDLIQPDVISADRSRYETAGAMLKSLLVNKAIRRGKNGYRIGHLLDNSNMSPHLRRPHPALVWTGEGRRIPRIITRKGSVVHKDKINQIPTGYMG